MLEKANPLDLKSIDIHQEAPIHPDWVVKQHPELTMHMHHPLQSVEEFEHRGNHVRITTTYQIEINGKSVMPHASITQQGHLECHSTPYASHATVADLVKSLINNTPEACVPAAGDDHGHEHQH